MEVRPELDASVPDKVREVIEEWGILTPHPEDEDFNEVYQRAHDGCCMTCGQRLGSTAFATVCSHGVVMVYCGGACYTDMQIIGYLAEQHQDVVDRVKFRGGEAPDG